MFPRNFSNNTNQVTQANEGENNYNVNAQISQAELEQIFLQQKEASKDVKAKQDARRMKVRKNALKYYYENKDEPEFKKKRKLTAKIYYWKNKVINLESAPQSDNRNYELAVAKQKLEKLYSAKQKIKGKSKQTLPDSVPVTAQTNIQLVSQTKDNSQVVTDDHRSSNTLPAFLSRSDIHDPAEVDKKNAKQNKNHEERIKKIMKHITKSGLNNNSKDTTVATQIPQSTLNTLANQGHHSPRLFRQTVTPENQAKCNNNSDNNNTIINHHRPWEL